MKEELEKICMNCESFLPLSLKGSYDFGICLNDDAFEPFIEDIMEREDYSRCRDLIDEKKFDGDRDVCDNYVETEIIGEIDDVYLDDIKSSIGKDGKVDTKKLEKLILKRQFESIDWATYPVEEYVEKLQSRSDGERRKAVETLEGIASLGSTRALEVLFDFFRELPPPATLKEVHFKKDLLRRLARRDRESRLAPVLVDELYRMDSNNTTRQYFSAILGYLDRCPREVVREPLRKMLESEKFSYRIKRRIRDIMDDRVNAGWLPW